MKNRNEEEQNIFLDEEMNGDRSNIFGEQLDQKKEERERRKIAKQQQPENIFDKE